VPGGLPRLQDLPEPPLGRLNLLHHGDGATVAVFDPRSGEAEAKYELADPDPARAVRVRGRYAPLRSGAVALYRDGAGRVVVQRGRRHLVVPDDATVSLGSLGPLLTLKIGSERLWLLDSRGRPATALLRAVAGGAAGEWV
jgi:hypothetical protein